MVKGVDMKTKPNTIIIPNNALDSWISYYLGEHSIHCDMVKGPGVWVFTPKKRETDEGVTVEPMTWEDVRQYKFVPGSLLGWLKDIFVDALRCALFHRKYHQFIKEYDGNWYGCRKCRRVWRGSTSAYD